MRIIALLNLKGGVGKTTLAAALGVEAAKTHRVGLVDLDAQQSLAKWMARRPRPAPASDGSAADPNPDICVDELSPADAIDKLRSTTAPDIVILDGPPSFIDLLQEAVDVADLVVVPLLPSTADLESTADCVALIRRSAKPMLAVINRGRHDKLVAQTRAVLDGAKVPTAATVMDDRVSHVHGWTVGKTAAEVQSGRDKQAAAEIADLWAEVAKAAGIKLTKQRGRS